jgi:N-acyl-D-amino-acid deacylase
VTDLLIRGGTVIDGSGAAGVRGDVAITGTKITDVGQFTGRRALRMIDARGKVVAPASSTSIATPTSRCS